MPPLASSMTKMRNPWEFGTVTLCVMVFLLGVITVETQGVRIQRLVVPEVVLNGTEESIILDCDYDVDREEALGLVVNWYFNGETVYQWIHKQKPQALGVLKGRLNLDFKMSEDDLYMYRALQIYNPTTDLSGEYGCKVSTFAMDALMKNRMIVYAPPTDWGVKVWSKPNADYINVTCWADGAYPEPRLTIFVDGNDRDEKALEDVTLDVEKRDGAYRVIITKMLDVKDIEPPTVFDCELKIPNTSFVSRNHTLYSEPLELSDPVNSSLRCEGVTIMMVLTSLSVVLLHDWMCRLH